ncbi:DUF3099 domain-containing protein [Nocardioides sp. TRM66260-LWL]|uniref:DUF3099 domain-containing protein n=1 Tax=Nocardioides sp. TRM66260-LWL TaxID=2874478 RepID=UPI001CC488D4|nr:DUF3099 domain-containing protein [Nocardioides sp. TRM66260-LWL]MBZ5736520.1 DUF3099 domain-containing protein [Nocardioides sp. TRM66260-LWL]
MRPLDDRRRRRLYFVLMGTCLVLVALAWNVVRLFSVPLAIAMSVVAALIPPVAAILGNLGSVGRLQRRGFAEPSDRRDDGPRAR